MNDSPNAENSSEGNSSNGSSSKPEFDNQQRERTGVLDRTANIIENGTLEDMGISHNNKEMVAERRT